MSSQIIVTLIADPRHRALTDDAIALARQVIEHAVGTAAPADTTLRTLCDGVAAEITAKIAADCGDETQIDLGLRKALEGRPLDIAVQRGPKRKVRLFLADMDSTMIEQECIDELADYVGLKTPVAEITARAMRGEIAFEPALRERVALLKGLDAGVVDEIVRDRLTLMPGGRELVATMRRDGAYACLVSGGFTMFTSRVAAMLGFDEHRSNELLLAEGKLAGKVAEPILGKEAKLTTLIELREARGIAPQDVMAVGDGANDLAMLGEAGIGVALHAKPAVAAAAKVRIDHGDLTALLYLQGYTASEFSC